MQFSMVCRRVLAVVLVFLLIGVAFVPVYAQGPRDFQTEFEVAPTSPGTNQTNPSLAVSSTGAVYVAWEETVDSASEIFVVRSLDEGATFETPIQVTDSDGDSNQTNPSIALSPGGLLVIAWEDRTDGDSDIFVSRSSEPWGTFNTPVEASDATDNSDQINPAIVIDSQGKVYVAWEDYRDDIDIRTSHSPVSSLSFGASVKVNDDTGNAWQHEPSITVDLGDEVFIAWYDRRDVDPYIYISRSNDGGATYGPNVLVDDAGGPQFEPSIGVYSNKVLVVWQDGRSGLSRDIYYNSAPLASLAFGASFKLNSGTTDTNQREPHISIANGNVHVVWHDFRDLVHDIYYTHSDTGGSVFAEDQKVNEDPGNVVLEKATPEVFGVDGAVFIVWKDERLDDSRIMMTSSGEIGDGDNGGENGEGNGDGTTDSLNWYLIIILIIILVIIVAVVVLIIRRRRMTE